MQRTVQRVTARGPSVARGFEVLIDRRNFPTLEDWRRELLVLIRADTVVFIVSPRLIAAIVCQHGAPVGCHLGYRARAAHA